MYRSDPPAEGLDAEAKKKADEALQAEAAAASKVVLAKLKVRQKSSCFPELGCKGLP